VKLEKNETEKKQQAKKIVISPDSRQMSPKDARCL